MSLLDSFIGMKNYFDSHYGVFNSFSGADIVAYIQIPSQPTGGNTTDSSITATPPIVGTLGNLQTISYSVFREEEPVRSLGKISPDSYTRGPRTIAGTLIWTVFDQYVLAEALKYSHNDSFDPTTMLIDQLPPFNVIITLSNEYGAVSTMGIYGIRVINEGSTFSIDDMLTEQTNTYVAAGLDLMHKGPPFRDTRTKTALSTGTDILLDDAQRRMSFQKGSLY